MSFLLCGQTDSGKSTISGHLLYKVDYFTSTEDDLKFYRNALKDIETSTNKAKWSLLMDMIDGEILNNKTKTVDFEVCNFSYKDKKYNLVDTPGHKIFIRSLVSGLFKIKLDLICLVVSSIPKEFEESFEKGTVKEDLLLARSTGCKNLLVLCNKCDLHNDTKKIESKVKEFSKKLAYKNIEFLPVSGWTGQNLPKILEVVDKYRSVNEDKKECKEILTDKILVETLFFIDTDDILISSGYTFVLHSKNGEYDTEVMLIKDKDKNVHFINSKKNGQYLIKLFIEKKMITDIGDRVVFRSADNHTLGFGVVKKCL